MSRARAHQWQPIETAPKDGQPFLVTPHPIAECEIAIVRWDRDLEEKGGQCWRGYDNERVDLEDTSVWMALPAPPEGHQ